MRLHSSGLAKELIEQGILPEQCRTARLILDPNDALILQVDIMVTTEMLERLGVAIEHLCESHKESRWKP